MTNLAAHLERLGLEQYLDAFVAEGFDTWETLLDVQETDLEALSVKLGHRRKLQRAIADYRGISYERLIGSPPQEGPAELTRSTEGGSLGVVSKDGAQSTTGETKRKYRRHPKPDDNAPEKPPSAYVLFSNKIREEVKSEGLSFTEIAKLVGDRWQKLEPVQKEPFETQASSLKEQYNVELSAYRKTDSYKEYAQYLNEFKAKHGPQAESKRPKLDAQNSGGSISAMSTDIADTNVAVPGHTRVGSVSSMSAASFGTAVPSPAIGSLPAASSLPSLAASSGRNFPPVRQPASPQAHQPGREPRLVGQLSTTSSTSDDSGQVSFDALSRTATLSLSTPPTGTPPLPPHALTAVRPDPIGPGESHAWHSRTGPSGHQSVIVTSSGPSPLGSGITLPSPTFPVDSWRDRPMDWIRTTQGPPSTSVGAQVPSIPLPPLLGPGGISELTHNPVQRILPPLRQESSSTSGQSTYQVSSPTTQLPRQSSGDLSGRYSLNPDAPSRNLDRNENEAANTLAGLAGRPGQESPYQRGYDRRRQ